MPSQAPKHFAFTTRYNGHSNKLIVKTAIAEAIPLQEVTAKIKPGFAGRVQDLAPDVAPIEYLGLWDTGATNSVISKKVVAECGLKPTGMILVHSATESKMSETFLVSVFLPNRVAFPSVKVTVGQLIDCDILIGMDIIGQGDFAVTNYNGKTAFSFRLPSREEIDFVTKKLEPMHSAKVSRNAPCPCGSGKKYKKCCGAGKI
jgi:hypothetical protein